MTRDLSHLDDVAAKMVEAPTSKRFAYIARDRVIETPDLLHIQHCMEELRTHPRIMRPPNLAVIAASGAGKTHAIKDYCDRYKPRRRRNGRLGVPVVLLEYPPGPSSRWLARAILEKLGYRTALPSDSERLFSELRDRLQEAGTRLVVVEEASRLFLFPNAHVREFYGLVVWLSNQTRIPIVLSGIEDLNSVIQGDLQLVRRFERLELAPWRLDKAFLAFLRAYLRTLPLAKPTTIDRSLQERLLEGSEGNTQTIVLMLQRAAKAAIIDGSEQILLKHVEIVDAFLIPPTPKELSKPRRRPRKGRRLPRKAA
jgi:hypothetical protein